MAVHQSPLHLAPELESVPESRAISGRPPASFKLALRPFAGGSLRDQKFFDHLGAPGHRNGQSVGDDVEFTALVPDTTLPAVPDRKGPPGARSDGEPGPRGRLLARQGGEFHGGRRTTSLIAVVRPRNLYHPRPCKIPWKYNLPASGSHSYTQPPELPPPG